MAKLDMASVPGAKIFLKLNFATAIVSGLHQAELGRNVHWEDAPHCNLTNWKTHGKIKS